MRTGGVVVSEQQPSQEALSRFAQLYQDDDISRCGACESQVWGIPWSEEAFIEQMVRFGHPATVKAGFPEELQAAVDFIDARVYMSVLNTEHRVWVFGCGGCMR